MIAKQVFILASIVFALLEVATASNDLECPTGSDMQKFPHPEDCTKYYQCMFGQAMVGNCPAEKHFNPKKSECDDPENAKCKATGTTTTKKPVTTTTKKPLTTTTKKPITTTTKKPVTTTTKKPITTTTKKPVTTTTKKPTTTTTKKPTTTTTKKPTTTTKKPTTTTKKPTTTTKKPTTTSKPSSSVKCSGNEYIPHPTNCSSFYQCSNGVPYLLQCPANLHFNTKINVCDWPDQAGCK